MYTQSAFSEYLKMHTKENKSLLKTGDLPHENATSLVIVGFGASRRLCRGDGQCNQSSCSSASDASGKV